MPVASAGSEFSTRDMPVKRKRNERADSNGQRPPPYRPSESSLAHHDRDDHGHRHSPRTSSRGHNRRSDRRDSREFQQRLNTSMISSSSAVSGTGQPDTPTKRSPPNALPISQQTHASDVMSPKNPRAPSLPRSRPRLSCFHYDIVTDDRLESWSANGRRQVIDHGIQSRQDEDITELATIYQEMIRSVIEGRLDAVDAGSCIHEMVYAGDDDSVEAGQQVSFNPPVLFLDSLALLLQSVPEHFPEQLREFLQATGISPRSIRLVLEPESLRQLSLVRDVFRKTKIRAATNILYRQANYNLLREESEGYSKLATELFSSSTDMPTAAMAKMTFERIKALVGTFDLDVGRVLDVTLDAAASMLIRNFRFFVKLFRVSSWWPSNKIVQTADRGFVGGLPLWAHPEHMESQLSRKEIVEIQRQQVDRDTRFWERAREIGIKAFYELGGRQVSKASLDQCAEAAKEDDMLGPTLRWIEETQTLPPSGNRVAAQLLGFKLRFYQSDARAERDQIPPNMSYLAALLIKIGFISLVDLYPHLFPSDDNMEAVREKQMKLLQEEELKKRPGGGLNALMTAGALSDDGPASQSHSHARDAPVKKANEAPADADKEKPKYKEPLEQKGQLLQDLLLVGAIPEALFFLGQFPWLFDAFPKVAHLIHRIIDHSIHSLTLKMSPFAADEHQCPSRRPVDASVAALVPRRWANPDDPDHQGRAHRFYWDEWSDNIPVCQTMEDFFTLCNTFLNVSGVNIGQDALLMTKICRLGQRSLNEDSSTANRDRWFTLLRRLLVPALSVSKTTPSVVNEVWALLQVYPSIERFRIYSEWYEGPISRIPAIQAAFRRTKIDTQSTMKRLSSSNIYVMARSLAKISFSSPGIVFRVALGQIEAYSNLIAAFVECARYFTPLGYDVLLWSLMSSLGGQNRSRTQETSVLLAGKWLQALSRFSGKVFQRYDNLDPTPVLSYVNNQLYNGNSTDLIILKELIASMSGIVSDVDFTDMQLASMTGGPVLRKKTLKALHDQRFNPTTQRSAKRLLAALVKSGIAGVLLVNLAQYIQAAMFNQAEEEAQIKFLANTVDETFQTLQLYLDLLRHYLNPDQFDRLLPEISSLLVDFGLSPRLAFLICRGSIAARLHSEKVLLTSMPAEPAAAVSDADGDVLMSDKTEAEDDSKPEPAANKPSSVQQKRKAAFIQVVAPLANTVRMVLPPEVTAKISPEFFTVFWSLQLGDLAVPLAEYSAASASVKKDLEMVIRDRPRHKADVEAKKAQRESLVTLMTALLEENKAHLGRSIALRNALLAFNDSWFLGDPASIQATTDMVLEHCVLPRLLISATDADYCHKLIKLLHEQRASNFTLKAFCDSLFNANRLRSTLFVCTVGEAQNLGRFLKHMLGDLAAWHGDKALYEKQAIGTRASTDVQKSTDGKNTPFLGFASKFNADGQPIEFIEHGHFQVLLFGWHKNLNMAVKTCLAGTEWMHIRNAITVLKSVTNYFPAIDFMGKQFNEQLKKIHQREDDSKPVSPGRPPPRGDLSVTAQTASAELLKKQSKWVMVQAFRPSLVIPAANVPAQASTDVTSPPQNGEVPEAPAPSRPPPPPPSPPSAETASSTSLRPAVHESNPAVTNATTPANSNSTPIKPTAASTKAAATSAKPIGVDTRLAAAAPMSSGVAIKSAAETEDGEVKGSPEMMTPSAQASTKFVRKGHSDKSDATPSAPAPEPSSSSTGAVLHPDRVSNIAAAAGERLSPQGTSQTRVPSSSQRRQTQLDASMARPPMPAPGSRMTPTGPASASETASARRKYGELLVGGHTQSSNGRGSVRRMQPRGTIEGSDAQVLTPGTEQDRPDYPSREREHDSKEWRSDPRRSSGRGRVDHRSGRTNHGSMDMNISSPGWRNGRLPPPPPRLNMMPQEQDRLREPTRSNMRPQESDRLREPQRINTISQESDRRREPARPNMLLPEQPDHLRETQRIHMPSQDSDHRREPPRTSMVPQNSDRVRDFPRLSMVPQESDRRREHSRTSMNPPESDRSREPPRTNLLPQETDRRRELSRMMPQESDRMRESQRSNLMSQESDRRREPPPRTSLMSQDSPRMHMISQDPDRRREPQRTSMTLPESDRQRESLRMNTPIPGWRNGHGRLPPPQRMGMMPPEPDRLREPPRINIMPSESDRRREPPRSSVMGLESDRRREPPRPGIMVQEPERLRELPREEWHGRKRRSGDAQGNMDREKRLRR